ncbi:hypothetical protein LBMAG42_40150 [Deltaproteobacteria bacterium]|nr:hypothetical protein LBMAG42_40150 [Deltaproteobacteria bacterium]
MILTLLLTLASPASATCLDPLGREVEVTMTSIRVGDDADDVRGDVARGRTAQWLRAAYGDPAADLFERWRGARRAVNGNGIVALFSPTAAVWAGVSAAMAGDLRGELEELLCRGPAPEPVEFALLPEAE